MNTWILVVILILPGSGPESVRFEHDRFASERECRRAMETTIELLRHRTKGPATGMAECIQQPTNKKTT